MTIVLGILASDGLVMAADTQETAGYFKLEVGKISGAFRQQAGAACLVSGAGHGAYLDAVARQVTSRFRSAPYLDDLDSVEPALAQLLDEFHTKHVHPFLRLPFDERPEFSLIVGCVYRNEGMRLFVSDHNVLQQGGPYVAKGVGDTMAKTMLASLYRLPMLNVWQTLVLVTHVVERVKDSFEGCGKNTDILYLRSNGGFYGLSRKYTKALADAVNEYAMTVEPQHFRWLCGLDTDKPGQSIKASRKRIQDLIAEAADEFKRVKPSVSRRRNR